MQARSTQKAMLAPSPIMNLRRIRMLTLANIKMIAIFAIIGLETMILYGLRQTPYYTTQSTIQLQNLNLAGASGQFGGLDFSGGSDTYQNIENARSMFYEPIVVKDVVKRLRNLEDSEQLHYRSGSKWYWSRQRLKLTDLSDNELIDFLGKFIDVQSDHNRGNLTINSKSEFPVTAKVLNELFVSAFIDYATAEATRKIRQSSEFFREQLEDARTRLAEADEKLAEFEKNNPHVTGDRSKSEYALLATERSALISEIGIKEKLVNHYETKLEAIKVTTKQPLHNVRDQFLADIQKLEYSRLKYISEGYVPEHPGIVAIDKKLARLKAIVGRNIASEQETQDQLESRRAGEITAKIVQLRDQIKEHKIKLANYDRRLASLEPDYARLPGQEAEQNRLRRDVDVASQLYLQLKSQVNLMNIRSASENGSWTIISWPGLPTVPRGLIPFWRLIIFGLGIGLALAYSILIARDSIEPRLIHRDDAEILSYHYAGRLSPNLSEQAEVLATLGQISSHFDQEDDIHEVITCASPDDSFGIGEVSYLTSYLATQRKASLTIILGAMKVPLEYGSPLNMDYADIYRHPDGMQDLVKISDKDTFVSLQNLISTSSHKYSAIFLLFKSPADNPSYPLGLKMSDKLLLCGAPHKHAFESYLDLTKGFTHRYQVFFSFLLTDKDKKKRKALASWSKGQRQDKKLSEFDRIVEAERRASNAEMDAKHESGGSKSKDVA